MKINVLIIDNNPNDPAVKNMESWVINHFAGSRCNKITDTEFNAGNILANKPDVIILDVALKKEEEIYFDKIDTEEFKYNPSKSISGIEYCLRLKANFSNLPVLLSSKYFHPSILAASVEAGADGFIYKQMLDEGYFIPALKATFYKCKTDDISFYEKLRELLENTSKNAWKREHMLRAMDAFFTRGSGARRLTGLWCNLAELVEELLHSEVVNKLLRALIDTEALLLAVNPRMRNHVRHAGNVFWLGYYLLNSMEPFREPERLPGYQPHAYDGSPLTPFEQLNLVWLLSALLHDIGYLRERLGTIDKRMMRTCTLFGLNREETSSNEEKVAPELHDKLKEYITSLGSDGKRLYSAISKTLNEWGNKAHDNLYIVDHGIASASAFISSIIKVPGEEIKRPEIFHTASTIALHNLSKWNKYWPEDGGLVPLPIGILPSAWLLGFCDELQGWGREPEIDPFDVDSSSSLSSARRKYGEGHIKGSRITNFELNDTTNCELKTEIKIGIQYMMVGGDNANAVSADVREGILKWKRERAPLLKETLMLDSLIETTIIHWIPGSITEPIIIKI